MKLLEYCERHYCPLVAIAEATRQQYGYCAKDFDSITGCEVENITDDVINGWIESLFARKLAPWTIKTRRNSTLVLIRHAANDGLCTPPKKVRQIRTGKTIPVAFTMDDMDRIFDAVNKTRGYWPACRELANAAVWDCYVRIAFDSGLRVCDLIGLRFADISEAGVITIIQKKTGFLHRAGLKPSTMEALERIRQPDRKRVFPLNGNAVDFNRRFKRVLRRAGIKGTLKMLRKTSATQVANERGFVAASQHLGHRDPNLAVNHYVDQRQLTAIPQGPPELMTPAATFRPAPQVQTAPGISLEMLTAIVSAAVAQALQAQRN